MKFIHFGLVAAAALFAAAPAAADKYGAAGCGLGSVIIGDDPGIVQIFAATTNGTSGNQTFGITSGTSNCEDTSGGSASAKAFVEANRSALTKDMARGRGETIASLSQLAGCANADAVGRSLQRNFKQVFPRTGLSNAQVSGSVLTVLRADKSLACSSVG